jgi:BASS family bile acid:Na+ symporter
LIHRYFLCFLLAAYVIAAIFPAPGLWLRNVSFGEVSLFGDRTRLSLPMLLLAFLLLNAGLGVQRAELRNLLRSPRILAAGLTANVFVPVLFILAVSQVMRCWHNGDEVQHILVGLALVAAMPIAGSSTAWTQNANGDVALGLGLVLFSTFLSPLTTPLTFECVEQMASGEYARALDDLEDQGTGVLLLGCVLLPSLLGIGLHFLGGQTKVQAAKPGLKLVNSTNLWLLNYANAAVALPQVVADPDWDFLAVTLAIVVGLCVVAFASGWWLSRLLKADANQRISLMFGLGMNNNGTGLVLASMALAHYPRVLLPIICYNLVQHLVAGAVNYLYFQPLRTAASCPSELTPTAMPSTVPTLLQVGFVQG